MSNEKHHFYILRMSYIVTMLFYSGIEKVVLSIAPSFLETSLQGFWNTFLLQIAFKQSDFEPLWPYGCMFSFKQKVNSVCNDRKLNPLKA